VLAMQQDLPWRSYRCLAHRTHTGTAPRHRHLHVRSTFEGKPAKCALNVVWDMLCSREDF
jgi:hypothetical protein